MHQSKNKAIHALDGLGRIKAAGPILASLLDARREGGAAKKMHVAVTAWCKIKIDCGGARWRKDRRAALYGLPAGDKLPPYGYMCRIKSSKSHLAVKQTRIGGPDCFETRIP